jgi:iron complex outermembrane receptor protein
VYLEEAIHKFNLTNSLSYKNSISFEKRIFGQVTDGEIVDANGDGTINAIVVNGRHVENEHLILDAK